MSELLKISNVTVEYKSKNNFVKALDDVSVEMPSTRYTLGIVGESGSGKTTLGMSILNAIELPGKIVSGHLEFMGRDVLGMNDSELRKYRWQEVSMVYQAAMNSLNPVKTVIDHIAEVLIQHHVASKNKANEIALKLLTRVGIPENRANDYPHELSGGMRQRVVIAMALALSPKLLIADEPTSALDVVVQRQILLLLKKEILENGLSLIFITHEISLLNGLVDNVAVMYAGEIIERGPIDQVLLKPFHPYTEMLVGTLLTFDSDINTISNLTAQMAKETGQAPPVDACKYSNRCKYVFERCRRERPLLRETEKGVLVACHKYN